MSFQVPLPNAGNSEVITRPQASNTVRVEAKEAALSILPVGKVLEVTVSNRSGLGVGLMIQGQFVPALLPKGTQAGDKLQVRVEANDDALILKILGAVPNSKLPSGVGTKALLSGAMSNLLSLLLPEDKQVDIHAATQAFREASAKPPDSDPQKGTDRKDLPAPLKVLLERLRFEGSTLDEGSLKDSKQVAMTLASFAERSLTSSVREARHSVEMLSREPRSTPLERFVQALSSHLTELLSSSSDLGFDPKKSGASDAAPVKQQLALGLALSHYALASGMPHVLERVTEQLATHSGKGNPLLMLLQVALNSPLLQFQSSDGSSSLEKALDSMIKELAKLRGEAAPDKVVRGVLQKHAGALAEALRQSGKGMQADGLGQGHLSTARTIEKMLAGQDALNQVNTVFRSFGEPSILMIPLVIQGLAIPLEVLMHPPSISPDEKKGSKREAQAGYQRIEIRVRLPALGAVAVDVALRGEEALVTISLESEELHSFVGTKTELLSARLREVGFKDASVTARQGVAESEVVGRLLPPVSTVAVA